MKDYMDHILAQWEQETPEYDVRTMAVLGRLSRASRLVEKQIEAVFASHDLAGGRFDVLAALRRSGPPHILSPTELYNSLLITSGAMTHRLDHLTHLGYVERLPDPHDGRGSLVRLTRAGREVLDHALTEHLENERKMIRVLSREERKQLALTLRKLLIALGDTGVPSLSQAVGDLDL